MHLPKTKKRGLAIITTLMIITLLLALVGAFLTINRAGNRFTLNTLERRSAEDVCQAVFSYARFKLEDNSDWGTPDLPATAANFTYPLFEPTIRFTESQEVGPDNADGDPTSEVIGNGIYAPTGNFAKPTGEFSFKIRNNLGSRKFAPGVVPKRSVRIEVTATINGSTRSLRALLRPKAVAHESVSAGSDLNLGDVGGLVRIESDDPYSNQLRAGQRMDLPDVSDVRFAKHGVASSGGDLNVGSQNLATAGAAAVRNAGDVAGGVFAPNAVLTNFSNFEPDRFDLPTATPGEPPLAGGEWVFGDITHYEYREVSVGYTIEVPDGDDISGSVDRFQRRTSLYNSLRSPDGQTWTASTAIPGSTSDWEPPPPPDDGFNSFGAAASYGFGTDESGLDGGGDPDTTDVHQIAPGFIANVVTAQFVVNSGRRIEFAGDFVVTGEGDRDPELYFGYDMDPDGVVDDQYLDDGAEAAQDSPSTYMGALVAAGDLNVTGGVLGYGSMIAGGDLTIKASSGLRVAPGLGVVVKGNNIFVNPATEPEPTLPGEPVEIDNEMLRDAINGGGTWSDFEDWIDKDSPTREPVINDLQDISAGKSATAFWSDFNTRIGGGGAFPGDPPGWSNPITVDQYVRLKTFYQTKASLYNDGAGQPEWLDLSQKQSGAHDRVALMVTTIAQSAVSHDMSFQNFLVNPPSDVPDMFIEGLVFADNDITIDAGDGSAKLKGAVVAKDGNFRLDNATKADLVYSRDLLDDLATGGASNKIPLETVFFTIN